MILGDNKDAFALGYELFQRGFFLHPWCLSRAGVIFQAGITGENHIEGRIDDAVLQFMATLGTLSQAGSQVFADDYPDSVLQWHLSRVKHGFQAGGVCYIHTGNVRFGGDASGVLFSYYPHVPLPWSLYVVGKETLLWATNQTLDQLLKQEDPWLHTAVGIVLGHVAEESS